MAEFKGKKGHWVTTESGSHLFIEDDGTYEEAVEKAFGKENASKYKKYEEKPQKANMFDTEEEYKESIKLKIKERYQEYKNEGYSKEEIIDELKDEFGYQDLIDDVMKEGSISDDFDNDYDFENWGSQAISVAEEELGINALDSNENYEQVCDWLIANEYAEDYNAADKMIKDSLSPEGWEKLNKIREEWGIDDVDDFDDDDWSKWATKMDQSVPKNWKSDGWDGDTRFYKVNNQQGVKTVSTNPNGHTSVYTTNGYIGFNSLKDAQEFMNAKSKKEATDIAWKRGWLGAGEEQAINDMFGNDNDFDNWEDDSADFDNDLEAAFKKHGPNDDAILDELRATGKDYGMSNSDLQAVVESYTLRHGGQSFIPPRRNKK